MPYLDCIFISNILFDIDICVIPIALLNNASSSYILVILPGRLLYEKEKDTTLQFPSYM